MICDLCKSTEAECLVQWVHSGPLLASCDGCLEAEQSTTCYQPARWHGKIIIEELEAAVDRLILEGSSG